MKTQDAGGGGGVFHRLRSDDGVSLMELMVAMTVFMTVMVGFAASMMNGLDLARNNRHRVVAANIADERMSILRSTEYDQITHGREEDTVDVGGVTYTVVEEAELVALDATTNSCDSPDTPPAYLRATVDVSWPRMDGVQPVHSETIIAPPVDEYHPYRGHLAVTITDRDGNRVPAQTVFIRDLATGEQESQMTTSDGCAFFDSVEAGEYYVWLNTGGWVDMRTGLTNTLEEQPEPTRYSVSPATITPVVFAYDQMATFELTPQGAPDAEAPLPAGVPVTLAHESLNLLGEAVFDTWTIAPLFPFESGYDVWAGDCNRDDIPFNADPEHSFGGAPAYPGATRQNVPSEPGQTSYATILLASVDVLVMRDGGEGDGEGGGAPVQGGEVSATDACGTTYTVGFTDDFGRLSAALPYGEWTFTVAGEQAVVAWPTMTLAPGAAVSPEALAVVQ